MGACFSRKRSTQKVTIKNIRVVHFDGSLQDYEDPATVDQVISNFPTHFLCTPAEILQSGLVPLKLDHQLKTGQIYFILPISTLKFHSSPDDLSSLTRKLLNIAKTGRCPPPKSLPTSSLASPLRSPQATSVKHNLNRQCDDKGEESLLISPKSPIWKPLLDTITES